MIDYDYFYKDRLDADEPWPERWDLMIASWDDTERVRRIAELSTVGRRDWLLHPQYRLSAPVPVAGNEIVVDALEDAAMVAYLDRLAREGLDVSGSSICVDITGMMRPHLMFLVQLLHARGVRRFDAVYAEPRSYRAREETQFNDHDVLQVREVIGFGGVTTTSDVREVLVVGPGFDTYSLQELVGEKEGAELVEIFGPPSLQADMYQLNVLKAVRPVPRDEAAARRFASASDPFSVAGELSRIKALYEGKGEFRFYYSPLGTKAQALGFALFYMAECRDAAASILYPFTASYAPGTGEGVSGIWRYVVDFDLLDRLVEREDAPL